MNTDDNLFDPTRKFKSNTVPVSFIPFKNNEKNCNYCGVEYSKTLKFEQKYCENCLLRYTKDIGNSEHLDTYIKNHNTQCIKHKATRNNACATDIQEWCEHCSEILYFTHLIPNTSSLNNCSIPHTDTFVANYYETGTEYLIFKLIEYGKEHHYQISSEWVKSILTKKSIQILYLPWWDNFDKCVVCLQELKYIHLESVPYYQKWCQKWCSNCFIIYTGCRYCLTTNIIFGITSQSQCKNCERISLINVDITNISSENCDVDYFTITKNNTDSDSLKLIRNLYSNLVKWLIEWIPYSQLKDLRKIGEGGFSTIYKATWSDGIRNTDVALKKLFSSQKIDKNFLNELKLLSYFGPFEIFKADIIGFHGITQDLATKEYILIMEYANGGNLHDYLQNNFINITWKEKSHILAKIITGPTAVEINREWGIVSKIGFKEAFEQAEKKRLELIQEQARNKRLELIGALEQELEQELEQTKEKRLKLKEEQAKERRLELIQEQAKEKRIELLRQARKKRSQLIQALEQARKKRLDLIQEQARNKRLELVIGALEQELEQTKEKRLELKEEQAKERRLELIQEQAKEKRIELLRQARKKRSELIQELEQARKKKLELIQEVLEQAEKKRLELIQLKKLGPEFSEKPHPKAIYTSRVLSSLISKSSIDFSSINSVSVKQEYITKEYELDINKVQSSSTQYINSSVQVSNLQHQNVSGPLNNLTTNSLRKRNIEELDIETQKSKKNRERY
ncbi:uncharacterized protein OCT59_025918 [Rhizophagus irregularis]|uniref:uncharacterized protein n=1 Tax=Rhizophagus irregularis TaxID=588596 RepID=UPI003319985F|nr:hypothetical protein OCT59_025918 [Rhizophagus irregularis]